MKLIIRTAKPGKKDKDLGESYLVDETKDFHSNDGMIRKEVLATEGSTATNRNVQFAIIEPEWMDHYLRIKRLAQIIPLKDLGSIIVHGRITKNSVIADAGSGSGALACFLAHHAKHVHSYDIREDHLELAKKNKKALGLANLDFTLHDIYEGLPLSHIDAVTLDLPEPWNALPHAKKALRTGGTIIAYNPSIPQAQDFVNAVLSDTDLIHEQTLEILERQWEVNGRKVRPKTQGIGHSGFLTFVRKLK